MLRSPALTNMREAGMMLSKKILFLAYRDLSKKWAMRIQN
jgi:hypothetical protein